jgi:hypothetical protein
MQTATHYTIHMMNPNRKRAVEQQTDIHLTMAATSREKATKLESESG